MNKHVNKNKSQNIELMFVEKVERPDGMPPEVATEMLLRAPLTNRLRKTLNAARATYLGSILKPVAKALKLEARFKQSTWAQLCKWSRRAAQRRAECQERYLQLQRLVQKLEADDTKPEGIARAGIAKIQMARLEALAEQIEIFQDVADEEMLRRRTFCKRLSKVAPDVAEKLEKGLCPSV